MASGSSGKVSRAKHKWNGEGIRNLWECVVGNETTEENPKRQKGSSNEAISLS